MNLKVALHFILKSISEIQKALLTGLFPDGLPLIQIGLWK
jgi:hypothetical protein